MTLSIESLSKTYPNGVRALDSISLTVPTGVFGLLGPNGAGKSTLMRTIATLQSPDSGSIRFGEIDAVKQPDALRAVLGYLPQDFGLYPTMSADATLDHFATLKGITQHAERRERVDAMLQQVNLFEVRRDAVGGWSGGMRQRLGIAIALIAQPRLLIVDEPTAGLDPAERNRFLDLLAAVGDDVVVMLSTHIVEDVRELCPRMAIIAGGRVVVQGAPNELLQQMQGRIWRRTVPRADADSWRARADVISTRLSAGATVVHRYSTVDPGDGFEVITPDLEDVYFARLTQRV